MCGSAGWFAKNRYTTELPNPIWLSRFSSERGNATDAESLLMHRFTGSRGLPQTTLQSQLQACCKRTTGPLLFNPELEA